MMMALDVNQPRDIGSRQGNPRVCDATDCGRIDDPIWLVCAVEWQSEDLARAECLRAGFQCFAPRVRIMVPQKNRPAIRQTVPAFPGYIFVLTTRADWHKLKRLRGFAGVLHIIGDREQPAIMPTAAMETMLARASASGILERHIDPDLPAWVVGEAPPPQPAKASWHSLSDLDKDGRVNMLYRVLGLA